MKLTKTTCPYCGVGCGVLVTENAGKISVKGDPDHPANFGRLCSKGTALADTLGKATRLKHPVVDGVQVSWDEATSAVAERFSKVIEEHGPDAVAFYTSGQLLTEDYYVANKLMKGFIGSANIDTNSRLCMASTVAGHKRAFGADVMPGDYTDLEKADLVVLVGSNLAWCHPVIFQRLKAAKEKRGTKIIVIDPRRTETCDIADLHLPIMPGGDVALFNGLLNYLVETGHVDAKYVVSHVVGYSQALDAAEADAETLMVMAREHGIEKQVQAFFELFASTEKTVTVFSQGVNQAHDGTDRVNAITNCHLATGRIGQPGMGPFSVTGQPNAMGGREVGGLANMLAAHMAFAPEDVDRVRRFWKAPNIASKEGLRAVDMFEAVHSGKIKAIWIMGTNPAVSMPHTSRVRQALERCPTVVVSDCVDGTDTLDFAHIKLPAAGWSEKSGAVTNTDRTISRQRAFLPFTGEAKPDWKILCDVAQKMGWAEAFSFESPSAIFNEHAALSAFENGGTRAFDISGLQHLSPEGYEELAPQKWPVRQQGSVARLFEGGEFATPDGRATMVAVTYKALPQKTSAAFPLLLNTGRYRDQWHTMTRTGLAPQLNGHRQESLLEIHPKDAATYAVTDGGFVSLSSEQGCMTTRVHVTDSQQKGSVFLPIHWSKANAAAGSVGALIDQTRDPISQQPAFKATAVVLKPVTMPWRGFLWSRKDVKLPQQLAYFTKIQMADCSQLRLADTDEATSTLLAAALQDAYPDGDWLDFHETLSGTRRLALVKEGALELVFFAGADQKGTDSDWIASLFAQDVLDTADRMSLLAGRSKKAQPNKGPIVCACMQVGLNTIQEAVCSRGYKTAEAVGRAVGAGTSCGSCVPEITAIIKAVSTEKAGHEIAA